jgi:hypothetical protein
MQGPKALPKQQSTIVYSRSSSALFPDPSSLRLVHIPLLLILCTLVLDIHPLLVDDDTETSDLREICKCSEIEDRDVIEY